MHVYWRPADIVGPGARTAFRPRESARASARGPPPSLSHMSAVSGWSARGMLRARGVAAGVPEPGGERTSFGAERCMGSGGKAPTNTVDLH